MMRKKRVKKENSERWLLTYSDLITLLMIFFVVMYTMSQVDSQKYNALSASLASSLSPSFTVIDYGTGVGNPKKDTSSSIKTSPEEYPLTSEATLTTPSKELQEQLQNYLNTHDLNKQVKMSVEPRGLIISLKENVFFESGKANIQPGYKQNILEIADLLTQLNCEVLIEGHTDNVPIHSTEFPSNWELAATRAINVVHLFVEEAHFDPTLLSATSYGEYHPIASNETIEGRSQNRRIDIVLLSDSFYDETH